MTTDPAASLRQSFYLLVGTAAVAIGFGKLVGAENVFEPSRYRPPTPASYGADRDPGLVPRRTWPVERPEPTPMFGSNDRSRWATVKALVEDGTYSVGHRTNFQSQTDYADTGIIFRPDYESLDKVMRPDTGKFYSSKPPLLPTLVAGGYYALHHWLGWTLDRDRWPVVVILLTLVNIVPFAVALGLLAKLIEAHGRTDFGRLFAFTVAAVGTCVTPFLTTFTNHVPAACCVVCAVYPLVRRNSNGSTGEALVSGLFAGLAAAVDLPAMALVGGLFVPLAVTRPREAVLGFLPGALVPIGALLYCNYTAIGQLEPAYSEFGGGQWYEHAGSYWKQIKATADPTGRGLDFANEPKDVYAFHLSFGHHGWFSLTPVWLLGVVGLAIQAARCGPDFGRAWASRRQTTGPVWTVPLLGVLAIVVSAVVFGFYVWRSSNYGGSTCCARWLLWLTPLWVIGLLPAADWAGRSAPGRVLAALLLGVSTVSAFYPASNPWRNPWLMQLGEQLGYFRY